ncbi:MAG: Ig-like domain-containing protein [Muribaculaceae bacterium]|nr:Ig-like domain-containing protein [Muribaculaceae bacterium]
MKQFLTFLALIFSYMLCGAQATTLVVDNQTPGWLSSKINYGDQQTVENLTITGYIDGTDIDFIRSLNLNRSLRGCIDLRNVNIVKGGTMTNYPKTVEKDNVIPYQAFADLKSLRKFVYPETATSQQWCLVHTTCDTVIISNPNIKELRLRDYVYPTEKAKTKYTYIPDGVESIPDAPEDAYQMGIRFPTSIKSITDYGGMDNARIFAEMLNPENIICEYEVYTGTVNGGWSTKYPAIANSVIYVPQGTLEKYRNSALKNNQIVEYYDLESLTTVPDVILYMGDHYHTELQAIPNDDLVSYYIYSSSDESVAQIDADGNIIAKDFGEAQMTIIPHMVSSYCKGKSTSCNVKVFSHVTNISLPTEMKIGLNTSEKLTPTLYPIGKTYSNIDWCSDNPDIAFVDSEGNVTGKAYGKCTISATALDGGFTAECQVEVVQLVEGIRLSQNTLKLTAGETTILSASVQPNNSYNKSVIWRSSNESIATVDNNGKVTAVKGGEAIITVSSFENPEIQDNCTVTVIQPVAGVVLNKSVLELTEDESEQLTTTITPDNASNTSVNWTSSDVSVAMVSPDGTVYAIKPGQATIMATTVDGGFVALCKVTVKAKVVVAESLSLSTTTACLTVGETLQLRASVSPENTTNKDIRWTSTNTDVAVVSESGLVSAIKDGNVQIIASTEDGSNLSAICEISVNSRFVSIAQIAISPSSVNLAVGERFNLEVQITPVDATNKNINWSSTNPSVVIVDSNGQLTAKGIGMATIIASSQDGSNLSATCNVEVFEPTVLISSITIDPTAITGKVGETFQLTATITPENASDKTLVWSSDNSIIASVDSDGLLTLHAKGNAIIKASATDGSGMSATCAVVVDESNSINDIEIDSDEYVKIYNLHGILVYEGLYSESNLVSGTYIIISQGNRIKRIIR